MTGRESLIGAALAVVLVVGIVDAAAGHDDSSTSGPQRTGTGLVSTPTSAAPSSRPTPVPTRTQGRKHHRHTAGPQSATPVATTTSAAPSHSAAPPATPAATKSSPGVATKGILGTFTYATTGGEGTNIPGTQRSFPKTTEITNKLEGCGVSSTWKPIPQHTQKQVLCPAADGIKVSTYQTTISFYGVSTGEKFDCSGASYIYRNDAKAGDSWRFTCKSADAKAVQKSTVVGFQTIRVGGTAVRTLHVHVATKLKGDSGGTSTQDYWIATNKPILVKETGNVTATQQGVHYTSTYSLALKSLSPST